MLCKQCGRRVKEGIRFCPYCGCFLAGSEPLPECRPPEPVLKTTPAVFAKTPQTCRKKTDCKIFDVFSVTGLVMMIAAAFFGRYLFVFSEYTVGEDLIYRCIFDTRGYIFTAVFICAAVMSVLGGQTLLSKSVLMLGAAIIIPQIIMFISEIVVFAIGDPCALAYDSREFILSCVALGMCAAAFAVCAAVNKKQRRYAFELRGLTEYYLFLLAPLLGTLWTILSCVTYIPDMASALERMGVDSVRLYDTTKLAVAFLTAAVLAGVITMLFRNRFGKESFACSVTVAAYALVRMVTCVVNILVDLRHIITVKWITADTLWTVYTVIFAAAFSLSLAVAITSVAEMKRADSKP